MNSSPQIEELRRAYNDARKHNAASLIIPTTAALLILAEHDSAKAELENLLNFLRSKNRALAEQTKTLASIRAVVATLPCPP